MMLERMISWQQQLFRLLRNSKKIITVILIIPYQISNYSSQVVDIINVVMTFLKLMVPKISNLVSYNTLYTIKGSDSISHVFVCVMIIDPTTDWFLNQIPLSEIISEISWKLGEIWQFEKIVTSNITQNDDIMIPNVQKFYNF